MARSSRSATVEEYPSLIWIALPPILLVSAYFVRKWYLARRLRLHGIGKGAPGFQTNVRRIKVTPEIAARLRRGEDVSPEEIAAASAATANSEDSINSGAEQKSTKTSSLEPRVAPENEWLPESLASPKKRNKGKKR